MDKRPLDVAGHRLHAEHHSPSGRARGAVVLVHGLNSNLTEFGTLPQRLAEAGYHALAFDQRGFGESQGERGRTDQALALADIDAAAQLLAQHAPGVPMGLLGHSLGGAYAVAALATQARWRFGVLCHPVDRLWDEIGLVKRGAYHLLGRRARRRMARGKPGGYVPYSVHYSEIFVSREHALAARPEFLQKQAHLGNYAMALTMRASDLAPRVTVPTLGVWSALDRAVKPAHTKALFARLGRPPELLEHRGGHSCFRDLDGDRVAQGIVSWLDRIVPTVGATT